MLVIAASWGVSSSRGRDDGVTSPTTTRLDLPTTASRTASTPTAAPPTAGAGPTDQFSVAPGGTPVVGTAGQLFTYTVEVEDGIPVDPAAFAAEVDATLADPRGWTAAGDVRLQRVSSVTAPTFRVRLATPATVDTHCAPLLTHGDLSCRSGMDVMINLIRWTEGAAPSELPLAEYRHYVISHEVGHALGHRHEGCPSPGAVAPVMLQQTQGLEGCAPNPWPFP